MGRPFKDISSITPDAVRIIRARYRHGESCAAIAHDYHVTARSIYEIATAKTWRSVLDASGEEYVPPVVSTRRPVCPRCGGLLEADIDSHDEIFLACESCLCLWSGSVSAVEREAHELRKARAEKQRELKRQQQESVAKQDDERETTQEMAAVGP